MAATHPNKSLTDALSQMASFERDKGDVHRFYAYNKAVATLKRLNYEVTSGASAKGLPGIGPKIALKIQEILDTGKLQRLEEYKGDERQAAISLLTRVSGIGPKAAAQLVDVEGVTSLEGLRKIADSLTHHQQIGLKYFAEFELRVPREEVQKTEAQIASIVRAYDPLYHIVAVGSYRRGLASSGDVDLLITHPSFTKESKTSSERGGGFLDAVVARLTDQGIVTDSIASGPLLFMGVCQLPAAFGGPFPHRRLDMKLVPIESFPCALLHYTGSGDHNMRLRAIAKEKHFKLNEYELAPLDPAGNTGPALPITSEEDIFTALGVPYRTPSERV